MTRGKLIVFEGIDGSGTTTQAKILYEELLNKNYQVELTAEPSNGPIGKLLREYLTGEQKFTDRYLSAHSLALLFAADRLDHLAREINPWLEQGKVVISDRYVLSSLAYQALDCDLSWIKIINQEAPPPDLTFLLDLPVEIALKRVAERKLWPELFEKEELLKKIRENYLKLARELYSDQRILTLDGSKSIPELANQVLKETLNYLRICF